jgi:potassium efflux system protein
MDKIDGLRDLAPVICMTMSIPFFRTCGAVACFSCVIVTTAGAQSTNAPASTNTPSTNSAASTPATPSIPMSEIVAQAQTATTKLQDIKAGLDPDQALQAVNNELPQLSNKIDARTADDASHPASAATLNTLQASQSDWQSLSESLASEQLNLSKRVQDLDGLLGTLAQMDTTWKSTLASAQTAKTPPDITATIMRVRDQIADAGKSVHDHLTPLYTAQTRVAAQDARTKSGLDGINKSLDAARQQLFQQNRPALWSPESLDHSSSGVMVREKASLSEQVAEVTTYLKAKIGAVLVHLVLLALLIFGFFWIRRAITLHAEQKVALRDAVHIFDVPFANALLIALVAALWLYPGAPTLFWAGLGAVALIPTVIITRRLIDSASFPILYATVIAFFVDQLRDVITPAGVVSRFLFLSELMAASVFILTALHFKHLSPAAPNPTRLKRLTRVYLHLAFLVLLVAGFANILGYIKLSILVGNGMLDSSYLAVILYAAVRIVDALAISAMSLPPLSQLGMVRRHRDLLFGNVRAAIRWVFFIGWVIEALQFFQQRDYIWQKGNAVLWKDSLSWFNFTFTLGAVLAFPLTIWASFLISRFVRFFLQEEVYPHMSLGRGIPYAASTMIHYSVLLLGFFAAGAATGAELSQFAFLAGAFGVGLGFGLQNIINNFVSGVILLFERPIKVGDIVQMDATTTGTVERIGIRASVIRLTNGSELIVPNGNLISNPVTNWTLSNCERLIEIPVGVTSPADPSHVADLLTKTVAANAAVMKNPPPQTLLVTFTGAALSFKVRAWVDSEEEPTRMTSELSFAIHAALAKENIVIS